MPNLSQFSTSSATSICTINGRTYYKRNSGFALIGVKPPTSSSETWVGIVMVALEPSNVVLGVDGLSNVGYNSTTTYDGKTWYVNIDQYSLKGNYNPSGNFTQRVSNATDLLNWYYGLVTVSAQTGGSVSKSLSGNQATIYATPDTGYVFTGWYSGNTKVSNASVYTFTLNSAVNYTAHFIRVDIDPTGSGYIVNDPNGLLATPNDGWKFSRWTLNNYTRLEYIESSGSQYIATGVSGYCGFDMKFHALAVGTSDGTGFFGHRTNGDQARYGCINYNNSFHFMLGANSSTWNQPISTSTIYTITSRKGVFNVNGTNMSWDSSINCGDREFYLFGCNAYNGLPLSSQRL